MIYVEPASLADRNRVAEILADVVDGRDMVTVMIFDNKARTPWELPMTDTQMLSWKASYERNRTSGHERFYWLTLTDANTSPPEHDIEEDDIRPGRAGS